ncbi:hypothetical protein, partial [Cysteiniphilum litorale]|uniref:hypothetical protein n=1 Tax=Cysteiniphilum litorale TaxID=2056700 RepID=UPI003F885751
MSFKSIKNPLCRSYFASALIATSIVMPTLLLSGCGNGNDSQGSHELVTHNLMDISQEAKNIPVGVTHQVRVDVKKSNLQLGVIESEIWGWEVQPADSNIEVTKEGNYLNITNKDNVQSNTDRKIKISITGNGESKETAFNALSDKRYTYLIKTMVDGYANYWRIVDFSIYLDRNLDEYQSLWVSLYTILDNAKVGHHFSEVDIQGAKSVLKNLGGDQHNSVENVNKLTKEFNRFIPIQLISFLVDSKSYFQTNGNNQQLISSTYQVDNLSNERKYGVLGKIKGKRGDVSYVLIQPLNKNSDFLIPYLKLNKEYFDDVLSIYNQNNSIEKDIKFVEFIDKDDVLSIYNQNNSIEKDIKFVEFIDKLDATNGYVQNSQLNQFLGSSVGVEWLQTEAGQTWLLAENGKKWLSQ